MTAPANDNGSAIDLRLGRWQTALADVGMVDCLISDPPFSARTHEGLRVGVYESDAQSGADGNGGERRRDPVLYESWDTNAVDAFVSAWATRVRGWFVVVTDHILWPAFEAALLRAGRYVFQPLPFVELGKQPRLAGDGPASWTCWIVAARPPSKPYSKWGSLPGAYVPPSNFVSRTGGRTVKGGKPLWLMQQLVRDYSRPGDLICDPCAGGATTLLAAAIEGRRGIGSEMDPNTFAKAQARIARGYTPVMRFGDADRPAPEQQDLLVVER